MGKLIHEKLSGNIIAIAMQVLNELKPGLDGKQYGGNESSCGRLRVKSFCIGDIRVIRGSAVI
jgi:hypothetical protein